MINPLKNIVKWCNQNAGFLGLIAVLVAIFNSNNFNNIDLSFTKPFFGKIWALLTYKIEMPLFVFLVILVIGLVYWNRIKNRYTKKMVNPQFLNGNWKNEWTTDNDKGTEDCIIRENNKYYIMGKHWFDLKDFKYSAAKNEITFWKVAVQPGDPRRVLNRLKIINNDLLVGEEDGHDIRYSRIYG